MRKVILNLAVSLDGFIEGPNGEYDWCFADQDYGMTEFFEGVELIFMGRKSYDLISSTGDINAFPHEKYVFSDTLDPELNPLVHIVRKENFVEQVNEIKEQPGGAIWLFGGAGLIDAFLEHHLIDEFLLSVHPILLGGGKRLFNELSERIQLQHAGTENYSSGLVQIRYLVKPKFDLSKIAGADF